MPTLSLLALLTLALPLAASAQPWPGPAPQRVSASSTERSNDQLVGEALRELRVQDTRSVRAAIPRAFSELWPGERYDRYRLSRTQARALALTAADFGETRRNDRRDDRWDDRGNSRLLGELNEAVYRLAETFGRGRSGLFLTSSERSALRADASEVRRLASQAGCFAVADLAVDLRAETERSMVDRDRVSRTVGEMRAALPRCR